MVHRLLGDGGRPVRDAICRERDGRREAEFASRMPGFCEAVWPLSERRVLLESLKRWSAHGEKVERRYLSSAIRLGRFRRDWQTRMWSSRPFGAATLWRSDPLAWSCFVHDGIAPQVGHGARHFMREVGNKCSEPSILGNLGSTATLRCASRVVLGGHEPLLQRVFGKLAALVQLRIRTLLGARPARGVAHA